ncbi:MAG: peptidoglycan-binding domain-containing protein [Chthoniobacterales bacterium]
MNWPLEQEGSTGENVRSVQYLLNAHGATLAVDGAFGPLTAAAVRGFQSKAGLKVDGIVGNATWPTLIVEVSSGSSGDAVRAVQSQISFRASGWVPSMAPLARRPTVRCEASRETSGSVSTALWALTLGTPLFRVISQARVPKLVWTSMTHGHTMTEQLPGRAGPQTQWMPFSPKHGTRATDGLL